MIISAVRVTEGEKKNDLILYAISKGCKAIYSAEYDGLAIQVDDRKKEKAIIEMIKKLEKE